ncbi:MAG: NADH-quinone oxidoreductase subunit M [Devosia sp.]|jgi:NADH-quinone oxidoreductase subunit M|uniref:NADH-quinone oxidoreductase subunit M n=1 Tax=unclassified Devosia TaxID=196773 RepID=UPI0019DDC3A8|nr:MULTISPECIES: NADH-quinone oxidoreductase subunit M [unclassified Devosia]MBF0677474.1 NADH-quinone oxidoreductase subunit M [Devosia sp.]WEJ31369.1 NADH-quinone oxidoreductase subunit M [Devosia sp. SD17-2]
MTFENSILTLLTFLPLLGAALILLSPKTAVGAIRWIALATTVVTLVLSLWMWSAFDPSNPGFQFVVNFNWLGDSIGYRVGVDGISVLFVVLSALLMPFCILASWESIEHRVKEYMIVFLVLEMLMIGVFTTLDLAMFYVFFEGTLLPMFLIIGIWGGKRRIQAAYKFFFYTFIGSVLMLLAIMAMYWNAGTSDISRLLTHEFPESMQFWLWLAFFASLAVKMPMWPFHRWLPEAHVEAPTAGSVILAAILLKLGGYGFLRFSLPMFPDASAYFANFVFFLSVAAIILTSVVALVQTDIKKLIAYSSVAHMGFVTMGIFAGNALGIQGAMFQMISHGLVSGALFLAVGVIYDRMHTRDIEAYGGLVERMPKYAFAFMVFTMANVGLPGTSGFVGEFLTMIGVFQVNTWVAFGAAFGMVFSACYALWLYRRVIFGALTKEGLKGILDLNLREKVTLYPLIVMIIVFGFYPAPILDTTASAVNNLVAHYATAVGLDPAVSLADARAPLEYVAPTGEAQPAAAAPAAH